MLQRELDDSKREFECCLLIANEISARNMQLECLLCLAYICFDAKQWKQAQKYFERAYEVSRLFGLIRVGCKRDKGVEHSGAMSM